MLKLDRFCCCCRLEIGGLIIAWLWLIANIFTIIAVSSGIFILSNRGCYNFGEFSNFGVFSFLGFSSRDLMDSLDYCHFKVSFMMGVTIAFLVIEIILAIFAICLMVAIRKESHNGVRPMMIFFFLETLCFLLSGFKFTEFAITRAILGGFIYGYLFLVLYSLFAKFRDDRSRYVYPTQVHFQQQYGVKV